MPRSTLSRALAIATSPIRSNSCSRAIRAMRIVERLSRRMSARSFVVAGAFAAAVASAGDARATLTYGTLTNGTPDGLVTTKFSADVGGPIREMFLNDVDFVISVDVAVAGPMLATHDVLTVQLLDGCGTPVGAAVSVSYDNSSITTAGTYKYLEVDLGYLPVTFGNYYFLDVHTNGNSPLMLNTDRFVEGRLISPDTGLVSFPGKKRDLMFVMLGKVDSTKGSPQPTTNIACPSKCVLANPSGVENQAYGLDNSINVLFRQRSTSSSTGSFWAEFQAPNGVANLKKELADVIQGTNGGIAIANTFPYASYFVDNNVPTYQAQYYPNMNFYIAFEDPALDVEGPEGPLRGFDYCANIDAVVDVVDAPNGYGGIVGGFRGEIGRPGPNTTGWGAGQAFTMVHELGGHGIAGLFDEYIQQQAQPGYTTVTLASSVFGYQPNSLPLSSSGCNEWCGGTKSLSTLMSTMKSAGDTDYPCWAMTTQAQCTPATIPTGTQPQCRWIGGLPAIPYWGTHKCIPMSVASYDIGTSCATHGNDACYPLAPDGTNPGAIMDVVQPGSGIMESFHVPGKTAPGFGTHVENHIKDLLDCVLSVVPCSGSKAARCNNLISRYGTPGDGYVTFLQSALACDATDGVTIRRR